VRNVRIVSTGFEGGLHGTGEMATGSGAPHPVSLEEEGPLPPGVVTRHTVEIESLSLAMESEHSLGRGEQTRIRVVNHDLIERLRIDGREIRIEFAPGISNKLTYDELVDAYENDGNFRAKHERLFKAPPDRVPGRFPASEQIAICTIVSGVTGLPPGVTVGSSPNEILIPDFGIVALGEMVVYTHERRLTLVRMALGCPTKGDVTLGDVGIDGNNWPP